MTIPPRPRQGLPRLILWLRATAFSFSAAVLVAWGVGDAGWLQPAAVVGSAGLGLGFLYWLFPRGVHFAIGTTAGMVLYATLFVVLGRAQFPGAPDAARAVAFLLPVLAFLATAWWRRREMAALVTRYVESDLDKLSHSAGWLLYAATVGLVCFLLPINRMDAATQSIALVSAMAVIAVIVAFAERDVVRLLVDVALIMHEISARVRHLVVPAAAFLLLYAMLVVVFASAYRIADGLSVVALFHGPGGPIRVSYSDALHFSLATLSTVGYGDIQPFDDGIRVLASLQVVAGQLLLLFGFAEIMRARSGTKEDDAEEPRRRHRHEEPGPPA